MALNGPVHAPPEGACIRMIRSAPAVRQSAMVTCHRKGREGLFCLHTFKGTGGGVIHRLSTGQAALEGVGIFP